MKQILGLLAGIAVGGLIGVVLVLAFAPVSGQRFRAALQDSIRATLTDAQAAAAAKRQQLQADYQRKVKA